MNAFLSALIFAALATFPTYAHAGEDPMPKTVLPLSCSADEAPNGNPSTCVCPPGYKYSWRNPAVCHYQGAPKQILKAGHLDQTAKPFNCSNEIAPSGHPIRCECPPGFSYVASGSERCVNLTPEPLEVERHTVDEDGRKHRRSIDKPADGSDSNLGTNTTPEKTPAK